MRSHFEIYCLFMSGQNYFTQTLQRPEQRTHHTQLLLLLVILVIGSVLIEFSITHTQQLALYPLKGYNYRVTFEQRRESIVSHVA